MVNGTGRPCSWWRSVYHCAAKVAPVDSHRHQGTAIFEKLTSQFAHGEISAWGIAALVSGAVAVFSANVAAFIPDSLLMGLHSTRLQHGNVNQIGSQVQQLRTDTRRMSREYRTLLSRFDLLDDDSGETVRRLAAVERSLPLLIESLPLDSDIDRSLLTASVTSTEADVPKEDGTTVTVRHRPLFQDAEDAGPNQPLPPVLEASEQAVGLNGPGNSSTQMQGVALGEVIPEAQAADTWDEIVGKAGLLLLGTVPLLDSSAPGATRLIAGPLPDLDSAKRLCAQLEDAAIACSPIPYEGERISF